MNLLGVWNIDTNSNDSRYENAEGEPLFLIIVSWGAQKL